MKAALLECVEPQKFTWTSSGENVSASEVWAAVSYQENRFGFLLSREFETLNVCLSSMPSASRMAHRQ